MSTWYKFNININGSTYPFIIPYITQEEYNYLSDLYNNEQTAGYKGVLWLEDGGLTGFYDKVNEVLQISSMPIYAFTITGLDSDIPIALSNIYKQLVLYEGGALNDDYIISNGDITETLAWNTNIGTQTAFIPSTLHIIWNDTPYTHDFRLLYIPVFVENMGLLAYQSQYGYSATDSPYGYKVRIFTSNIQTLTFDTSVGFGKVINGAYEAGNYSEVDLTDTDPYKDGGESGTGGGDGTFTGDNDPVDIPPLPTVGAQDAGFISLFAPTISQLKNLASFMWSDLFDVDTFKKIFNDPMDSILGLSVVPVDVPTSGAREITVGNIVTTVRMDIASQQYIEVDCGSVDFTSKYFGSYLDYEPYTKISIYVPYSGYHDLRADDIMGRVVRMVYHIDILTGSLVAFLKCGDSVLYEFNGACASNIPVTNISYNSTIENAMRIAVNIGTTVATAGASAPLSASGAINMVGSTAEGALSMKPSVGRSGSMGGTTGIMGNQIPYFIVTRPRICVPTKQNHYQGYPSFITYTISSLAGKGYTVFDTVLLKDINLTDNEKDELTSILKEGVYL